MKLLNLYDFERYALFKKGIRMRVDVNSANCRRLENVPNIGRIRARRICQEREKRGLFRDWSDFQARLGFPDIFITYLIRTGAIVGKQLLQENRGNPETHFVPRPAAGR